MFNTQFLETLTILYVEDEIEVAQNIQQVLNKIFKKVIYAKDGLEAFNVYKNAIIADESIDIIVSDIKMPNMDGIELLKNIRELDQVIPFILTSAFTQSKYLLEAIEYNVSYYAVKPIDVKKLVSHIQYSCYSIYERNVATIKYNEAENYLKFINQVAIVSKTDIEGKIIFVNDIFCDISGYIKEELIGQTHLMVKHSDMPVSIFRDLWSTIIGGKKWVGTIKNRAKDGSSYYVNQTIFPLYDSLNTYIKEYIAIGFLTTDDENKQQEFKSEVRKLVTSHNKQMTQLRKEKGLLKRKLRQSDITFLEDQLKRTRDKSISFSKQVNYYEQLSKDFNIKLESQAHSANEKIDKLFKNTQKLQKENNKILRSLDSAKIQIESLEKQTIKQFKELIDKSKTIATLRDEVSHREKQLGMRR